MLHGHETSIDDPVLVPHGTQRWPEWCEQPGAWIKLPKALIKNLARLKIDPNQLWLLLALQVDRYHDRPPRWYWRELAEFCGRDEQTIRRWARELKRKKLLSWKLRREPEATGPRSGVRRNYRNEFDLSPLLLRLESVSPRRHPGDESLPHRRWTLD